MSEKIQRQHLLRKAMLYVRQSSAYQVSHNMESQALQYAMQGRLEQLGWREIEVVDDDLGRSAAGTVTRTGFERMVAEVCLGKVGAVAAREVSRFARNSRDWQQLVEVCRVVDTVLIDQDTVYAPRHSNDRLLLGLKGQPLVSRIPLGQQAEQGEIAVEVLRGAEVEGEDGPGRIIDGAEQEQAGAGAEPVELAAVEQDEGAHDWAAGAAGAVLRGPAAALGGLSRLETSSVLVSRRAAEVWTCRQRYCRTGIGGRPANSVRARRWTSWTGRTSSGVRD